MTAANLSGYDLFIVGEATVGRKVSRLSPVGRTVPNVAARLKARSVGIASLVFLRPCLTFWYMIGGAYRPEAAQGIRHPTCRAISTACSLSRLA